MHVESRAHCLKTEPRFSTFRHMHEVLDNAVKGAVSARYKMIN